MASVATLPRVTLDTGKDAATEQDWELSCTGLAQCSGRAAASQSSKYTPPLHISAPDTFFGLLWILDGVISLIILVPKLPP